MLIERPPRWFRALFPGAVFRLPSPIEESKRVFITFDDGPIPEVTPFVLDTLDRFGVKATFFMVGQNIERYPAIMEEVKRRGHDVGNHTLHHMKGAGKSAKDYLKDVYSGKLISGSDLFRPPHGWIKPQQLKELKKENRVVMYDLVTRDYSRRLTAEDVVGNVKKYTRNGSIIVFHDSLKSLPRLKKALPEALKWISDEGYRFSLLSEVLPVKKAE